MKNWVNKAITYLDKSLGKVALELNEIDWKASLSPKNDKLCQHISSFSNLPGGGFLVFGVNDKTGELIGIDRIKATEIVDKLSSLCRDGVSPLVRIDHSIETYKEQSLLFIHIYESAIKLCTWQIKP
ncbi:ATP-binding protein [Sphingobacterium phlebotomi]|uniref:ATP-binding protein n=1 Tax=Sphingobacterium phlebotomi TaxID=2605433 RepID=A0A5D4H769_9SPHI|nr:ATP-binding protein [Sphingobacterium phlebotomi]TYR36911.1 ATP-binding protein [Sphingobacterium phlebotomi]